MSEIEKIAENTVHLPNRKWFVAGDVYRTSCKCTSEDHSATFYVDVDRDRPSEVCLNFSFNTYAFSHVWGYTKVGKWFLGAGNRIKYAWILLTKGYVETNGDFIFRGERQMDALCDAIQEAKEVTKLAYAAHKRDECIDAITKELKEKEEDV